MAETIAQLRALTDEEIISQHDRLAGSTGVGTNHYLTELARRDQDRATQAMLEATKAILGSTRAVERLTWAIVVLTALGVVEALVVVIRVPTAG